MSDQNDFESVSGFMTPIKSGNSFALSSFENNTTTLEKNLSFKKGIKKAKKSSPMVGFFNTF